MSKYVQYVVCKLPLNSIKYLFYAPAFANIKEGDEVLVDTQGGEKFRATVLAVCSTSNDEVERTFRVLTGTEDKPLKRVIGKYQFYKFDYSEDENNE